MSRVNVYRAKHWWRGVAGWPTRERFLASFLSTSETRDGVGHWGLIQISSEALLGIVQPGWTSETLKGALDGLQDRGWLVRDAGWIFVPELLVADRPRNGNELKGAARELAAAATSLGSSQVWLEFLNVAQMHVPELHDAIIERAAGTRLSSSLDPVRTPSQPRPDGVVTPINTGFGHRPDGVPTVSRLEGACGGARDTTAHPSAVAPNTHQPASTDLGTSTEIGGAW